MERHSFFDCEAYYATDWAEHIKKYFTNGVFNNGLQVQADGSMIICIKEGHANVEGYRYINESNLEKKVSKDDNLLPRIDTVVIRLDLDIPDLSIKIIKGTPSDNPVPSNLVRTEKIYDLKLAEIHLPANCNSITQSMIKDTRFDENECGIVTSTCKTLDTSNIYNQLYAKYEEYITKTGNEIDKWFDDVKDLLDTNDVSKVASEMAAARGDFSNLGLRLNNKPYCFNNVAEMIQSPLKNGDFVSTLGYYEKNDGGGGTYIIRTKSDDDIENDKYIIFINNELVAQLIKNNEMIDNVTCKEFTDLDTNTKYWITHIPHKDSYGNILKLKLGLANDSMEQTGHLETAREFAYRHKATVVINGGIADNTSSAMTGRKYGMRMKNGVLISNQASSYWQIHWALGITEDNSLVTFGPEQTEEKARELNCIDVTSGMTPILLNGVSQKFNIKYTNSWFNMIETTDEIPDSKKTYYIENITPPYYTEYTNLTSFESGITYYEMEDYLYQKQLIGQNSITKDIYVITCNGKGLGIDKGMSTDKIVDIFKSLNCDFAYQLDGGGSTALIYHGEMMNTPSDDDGKTERPCADFLYVSYEDLSPYSDELNSINKRISDIKRNTQRLESFSFDAYEPIPENTDLNNISKIGNYYCLNRSVSETLNNLPNINDFPGYEGKSLYGFRLTVERLNTNVLLQTIACEGGGTNEGRTYKFIRQFSHDGTKYLWREWRLFEFNETSKIEPVVSQGITINNGRFYCKNKRVCLNFEAQGSFKAGTGITIMTLPNKYRPVEYVISSGITNSDGLYSIAQIQVTTTGEVQIYSNVNSSVVRGSIIFDL